MRCKHRKNRQADPNTRTHASVRTDRILSAESLNLVPRKWRLLQINLVSVSLISHYILSTHTPATHFIALFPIYSMRADLFNAGRWGALDAARGEHAHIKRNKILCTCTRFVEYGCFCVNSGEYEARTKNQRYAKKHVQTKELNICTASLADGFNARTKA